MELCFTYSCSEAVWRSNLLYFAHEICFLFLNNVVKSVGICIDMIVLSLRSNTLVGGNNVENFIIGRSIKISFGLVGNGSVGWNLVSMLVRIF